MAISSEFKEKVTEAGIVLFILGLFLTWQLLNDEAGREQSVIQPGSMGLQDPSLLKTGGDHTPDDGIDYPDVEGHSLTCLPYNNPDNYWGDEYPRDTYDPSLPTTRTVIDILNLIGEPGVDQGPYYILINGTITEVRGDLYGEVWEMDANGKMVCVEMNQ